MRLEPALGCPQNAHKDVVTHRVTVHNYDSSLSPQIALWLNMMHHNLIYVPIHIYQYMYSLAIQCLYHLKNVYSAAPISKGKDDVKQ